MIVFRHHVCILAGLIVVASIPSCRSAGHSIAYLSDYRHATNRLRKEGADRLKTIAPRHHVGEHFLLGLEPSMQQPLLLSTIAGASTCLGAGFVAVSGRNGKQIKESHLSFALALAASVMITVSVVSIGPECLRDPVTGSLLSLESMELFQRALWFGTGCVLYKLLALSFPEPGVVLGLEGESQTSGTILSLQQQDSILEFETLVGDAAQNYKELSMIEHSDRGSWTAWTQWTRGADLGSPEARRTWRVAMLLFLSLLFHNFPEGLAVATSALESQKFGLTVATAIMMHNIPEGMAIAVPCLAARPDEPWLAFWLASLSGLAEPLGAFVALSLFQQKLTSTSTNLIDLANLQNVLAFVAGVMIMVAVVELLPESLRKGETSHVVAGLISGAVLMVATELYLA